MHVLSTYQATRDMWGVKTYKEYGLYLQGADITDEKRQLKRDLTI